MFLIVSFIFFQTPVTPSPIQKNGPSARPQGSNSAIGRILACYFTQLNVNVFLHEYTINLFSLLCLVWGLPLNSDDFLNAKKVQEMTLTEKTRQAIRAGIESVNNRTGQISLYINSFLSPGCKQIWWTTNQRKLRRHWLIQSLYEIHCQVQEQKYSALVPLTKQGRSFDFLNKFSMFSDVVTVDHRCH